MASAEPSSAESLSRNRAFSQGKIIKGTINDANMKISTSSIPHKYDNIITRSQTISAFGSGTNRFIERDRTIENLTPGPGTYQSKIKRETPSHSKKGYGPLISKFQRVVIDKMRWVPGPGSYREKKLDKQPTGRFGRDEPVHNLWKDAIRKGQDPSPAAYQNITTPTRSKSQLYTSIFKSNVKRNIDALTDAPHPATYHPKVNTFDGRSFSIKKPTKMIRQQNAFNSYFGEEKEPVGPGIYNPEKIQSPPKSFLIKDTNYDRFGEIKKQFMKRKDQTILPGPGDYRPKLMQKSEQRLKSMFQSQTQRSVFEGRVTPGFYNLRQQPKRIFHANPNGEWM